MGALTSMRCRSLLAALCVLGFVGAVTLAAPPARAGLRTGSTTGPLVATGTAISWSNSGSATITSSFFGGDVTCAVSSLSMHVTQNPNSSGGVTADATAFSLTSCHCPDGSASSILVVGLPWSNAVTITPTTPPNGTISLVVPGNGISVVCDSINCTYGGTLGGTFTAGKPAVIAIKQFTIPQSSCLDNAKTTIVWASNGPAGNGLYLG